MLSFGRERYHFPMVSANRDSLEHRLVFPIRKEKICRKVSTNLRETRLNICQQDICVKIFAIVIEYFAESYEAKRAEINRRPANH